MMEKSVSEALEQKGWMAWMYLIPERMVVRWEGLRVGKDTPRRVPPLKEKRNVISFHFTKLVPEITKMEMLISHIKASKLIRKIGS